IRSYHPDTGEVKWEWRWSFPRMPLRTTGSPILHNGMLLACAGDGGGDRHMAAVRLQHHGGTTRAEPAWENKKDFPYVPTLLARRPVPRLACRGQRPALPPRPAASVLHRQALIAACG